MCEDDSVLYCPYCGDAAEELIEVEDNDPSVGYYGMEQMCRACISGTRLRECEAAQPHPFTRLFLGWTGNE